MNRNLTLFDLDGTLIARRLRPFLRRIPWSTSAGADGDAWRRRNDEFYATYVAGALDVHAYVAFATSVWRGRGAQEQADIHARFMREIISPMLTPQALALVKKHQDDGDLVAIVTATNEFVTRPIAHAFGGARAARDRARARRPGRRHRRHQGACPRTSTARSRASSSWLAGQGRRLGRFRSASAFTVIPSTTCPSWSGPPTLSRPIRSVALEAVATERGWRFLRLFE